MRTKMPEPGKYIAAVSGGIDSVCLLDILARYSGYELVVAHFDHGIRPDSGEDLAFVAGLASDYGLVFVSESGELGSNSSEERARRARYAFLANTKDTHGAEAIITAHHQDDRLETLIINLIRGTGRSGLASIGDTETVKRPLLAVSKAELQNYALKQKLKWREDSTNSDQRYLRNYIRHIILPQLTPAHRQYLVELMDRQTASNKELDCLLNSVIDQSGRFKISRQSFAQLPYNESKELIASWLRLNNLLNFDRKTLERLAVAVATKKPGTRINVYGKARAIINKEFLALEGVER